MTLIALPSSFRPESFSMRLATMQSAFSAPFGGSEQVIDHQNDRWDATANLPRGPQELVASREAFVNAMRGQTNTVALYHFGRPVPLGTMRGTPTTLSFPAARGTDLVVIQSIVGATLLAGDMIGINGLLLQVRQDCPADGSGAIYAYLANRLRADIPLGSPVVWNRPTAPFRLISKPSFLYAAGYAEGASLDFVEAIV
jgi:hypothetical protein